MEKTNGVTRIPIRREGEGRGQTRGTASGVPKAEFRSGTTQDVARDVAPEVPRGVTAREATESSSQAQVTEPSDSRRVGKDDGVDWREAALRLKAEMDNFRKRQKRWAEDEARREHEEFLRPFLGVVDNLEESLRHVDPQDPAHQGVQMAYDSILSLLLRVGVERIFAKGRAFDPLRHEAVAVVPAVEGGVGDMHVVAVMSPGYMIADRILRPAKVVVAKQDA